MPEISVVMGVYNTCDKESLEKSINSVLNQTFCDFEFIICDDCSDKDYIKKILRDMSERDGRIKITANEKNMGLAASLNRCIELSDKNSKYIFRHDDDDFSEPDRFRKQYDFLENNPDISIVGSNIALYGANGKWGNRKFPEKPAKKDFLFSVPFQHGAIAFKKADLVKSGCYLSVKETRRTEDYELLMRMYSLGYAGYNIQEELYNFREDINSHKRRKYRYKIDEAKIRYRGFKKLKILGRGLPYIIKPLIVGLIPYRLLNFMKDKYYGRRKRKNT